MPKQSRLEHVADEVIALYQQGKSLREVAAVFNVSLTTVYRLLEKKGISRRPLSEASSIKWTPQRKEQHAAKLRGKPSGASGKRWTMDRVVVRPNARGKRNPKWRGGKTALALLIRTSGRYRVWREAVFARDSYTCVHCGVHSGNGHRIWLNADHVVPLSHLMTQHRLLTFEDAEQYTALWDVSNGRTLCVECHRATSTFGRNLVRD